MGETECEMKYSASCKGILDTGPFETLVDCEDWVLKHLKWRAEPGDYDVYYRKGSTIVQALRFSFRVTFGVKALRLDTHRP